MADFDDDDDDFGQKLPPLYIYLKRVLDKYPEGGQILKELVQNADDAGARRVVIVYDKTQHPTSTMWSETLHAFNGPSLYVYNDATFEKPDWYNIQHPEQSGKVDDPTKVGRFGLGFISVYHLTDIPSVLSGTQIGFLDPHEKYFEYDPHKRVRDKGKRGKKWRLSADILDQFPDQFNPYINPLFNCSRASFETGCFDGTIFRFPLRNTSMESQVSSAVYDDERIHSLYQSYQADAEISLLFLKNVESVSLYEKTSVDEKPRLLFSVEVAESDRTKLRSERKRFLEGVTLSKDINSICSMNIVKHAYDHSQDLIISRNKYVTVNTVKKEGISPDLQKLMVDKDLKLLPWVGVSMRVNVDQREDSSGRVFCFLPLPESEYTGLPVHVHGYFGLGDNRRSIKWPDRESKHDKAAKWNHLLVYEAFPDAFVKLIGEAIDNGLPADAVYNAWPDVSGLKSEWKAGVKNFLGMIKRKAVLYTGVNGGSWQKPKDVYIDSTKDDLVHKLLIRKGYPVANVPDRIVHALSWGRIQTKSVTSAIVRNAIKGDPLEWMTRNEKLHILKYILKDKPLQDLNNIHLLPLEDGTFTNISSSNATVYIPTDDIPSHLFPNMSSRFAAKDMPRVLREAQSCTQLKCLTHQMVPSLLKEALPRDWVHGTGTVKWKPGASQQPSKDWLEKIWTWLTQSSMSISLDSFSSFPLVQLDISGGYHRLARLCVPPLIYRQKTSTRRYSQTTTLPETMCNFLESLGVVVIRNCLPVFIAQHPHIDTIIRLPDVDGVTTVLDSSCSRTAIQNVKTGSDDLKHDIRNFFKHATLSDGCKTLLRQLQIFGTTDNKFVSVSQTNVAVPSGFHGIPAPRLRSTLLLEKDESDALAMKLGAQRISENDLLRKCILPNVENQYYSKTDSTKIMRWTLERPQFDDAVHNLRFLTTVKGSRRPIDLFPPDNPHLKRLFAGHALFPTEEYSTGKLLHNLKRVGLRGESSVTAQELLDIAVQVSESQDRDIATGFLEHITKYPNVLTVDVSRNRIRKPLGKFLQDRAWIPCKKARPLTYPDTLKWFGSSVGLCRPEEVGMIEYANLFGSVKPLVEVNHVRDQFSLFFNWGTPSPNVYPTVEQVAQHLRNTADAYQSSSNVNSTTRIVDAVYGFLNQVPTRIIQRIFSENSFALIWHGNGFTIPSKIAFSSGTLRVNLAPYLQILPSALSQYRTFLENVGVKQEFTENALNEVLHIIQEKHHRGGTCSSEYQTDLKLVCDILNSIIACAPPGSSFPDVLVPCRKQQGDTNNNIKMAKSSECLYVDKERLLVEYDRGECNLPVVHEMVPNQTAKRLGLRPLSHSVAPVDNVNLGYDVEGPHQSTVNAIKRNLDMYKEGLDIFKELIQNADDAGATEVKFLIDWRDNSQSSNSLLSEGMEMCHGPALWAYNDATFNEKDVKNICSIAAASKKDQLDKIGRFGLGFTSVYHITDVPSLISGPYVLIFDPRTNHLGNRINPGRPGIKLDIRNESHRATLRSYPNQFQPFQGIFNCDLSPSSQGFDKTLFRLPLRTEREVSDMSQEWLSKAIYKSQEEMSKMVIALKESAPSLLLFTQNVTTVSVSSLNEECTSTEEYKTLLDISVHNLKTLPRCISSQDNIPAQRKILQATHEWMTNQSLPVPESTTVAKVECKFLATKKSGKQFQKSKEYLFVVSSCVATGRVVDLARSMEGSRAGVLPCGGVAIQLGSGRDGRVPISHDKDQPLGGAFSYLPLDVYTGLPFHVNGNFLLQPNRRHLWSTSSSARKVKQGGEFETRWNVCFMEEVICKALINLLIDIQILQAEDFLDASEFQTLWPKMQHTESDFHPLVEAFYKIAANTDPNQAPNVIYNGNRWVSIHECFFINDSLRTAQVGDAIKSVLHQHLYPKKNVNLNVEVLQSMDSVGATQCLVSNSYDLGRFIREVFFSMIKNGEEIPRKHHKAIMLHLLDLRIGTEKKIEFDVQMKNIDCFPASPDGEELTSPEQMVHPDKPIGQLFKEEDGRFPYGKDYRREERLLSLAELGMATDNLEWDDVCERAESLQEDASGQLEKCGTLLNLLDKKLQNDSAPTHQQTERLRKASFLPVLPKPYNYPMSWHRPRSSYMSASELFEEEHKYLVGSFQPILHESCLSADGLSNRVKSCLGIGSKSPVVGDVIEQLRAVVEEVKPVNADQICRALYEYFNNLIDKNDHSLGGNVSSEYHCYVEELKSVAFILVDGKFLKCEQLAFEYKRRGGRYMYAVPDTLLAYKKLLQACGVKDSFSFNDYAKVVQTLQDMHGDQPLPDTDATIAEDMLKAMASVADTEDDHRVVLALDQQSVLKPVSELVYNDMSWTDPDQEMNYAHRSITEYEAKKLGIRTLRQLQLSTCSSGHGFEVQFGQKEKLTTRLKGILREYSHKADVLKELLQNADDAGATEIHIVYDPRRDENTKIVGPSWKDMHSSTALCVYNNRPFTDADLQGIQNVGVGGKISDATTTGRFGIGFNAVYHLTDCPTFVTSNEKLCVFDPHERYIPGATSTNPGRLYQLQGPGGCLATFPDMINGYLSEYSCFDLEKGTMFRFPLRTNESDSEVSHDTYTRDTVAKLLQEFQHVAKESLLFLNSIQKITISEIDPLNKELKTTYQITATISEEGIKYRKSLTDLSKQRQVHSETRVSEITQQSWIYTMNIEDSLNRSENWLISRVFGVDDLNEEIDGSRQFRTKAHLPRGGAAALLRARRTSEGDNPYKRMYKAFTFLPLQVYTGLPVHINGTFELDQSRRNLVKGDDYSQRKTSGEGLIHNWNKLLASHVIAPAYAKLIQAAGRLLLDPSDNNLEARARIYSRLFPSKLNKLSGEWELVAKATLLFIGKNLLDVLPVVKTSGVPNARMIVTWHHAISKMSGAFFDNLSHQLPEKASETCYLQQPAKALETGSIQQRNSRSDHLGNFLLKIGFRLVSIYPEICKAFQEAGVDAAFITPEPVMNHLSNIECIAHEYPCLLSNSAFHTVETIRIVLEYCLTGADKPSDLNGLPLRLTTNGILNIFSFSDGIYITPHLNVLPCLPELFIHQDLVVPLLTWCMQNDRLKQCYGSGIVKEFTLYEVGRHLDSQLPAQWKGCTRHVTWTPDANEHPSKLWMQRLWMFILERFSRNKSEELKTLAEWPIFPTTCGKVISPQVSKTVLYLNKYCDTSLRVQRSSIFRKLGCPRVEMELMGSPIDVELSSLLESYLAIPTKPSDILNVIRYMIDIEHITFDNKLTSSECDVLLRYFQEACENGTELSQTDINTLKKLPVFAHANSDCMRNISSFSNCHTVSSCNLPKNGIDLILTKAGCILLKANHMLKLLYEKLQITPISAAGIFLKYILPNFHVLSQQMKMAFVEHIRDKVIQAASKTEKEALFSALEGIAFIPDISGVCHTTSHYYAPTNNVFASMIDVQYLLPELFNETTWYVFLKHIGLQHEVDRTMFTKFAKRIADEATQIRNESDYKRLMKMAMLLVEQLDHNEKLWNSAFLQQIADIKFIPSVPIDQNLKEIHPPPYISDQNDTLSPFISYRGAVPQQFKELAWTVAMMLPSWAIPEKEHVLYNDRYDVISKIKVHECLGIETNIIMDKVLLHIQKVCQHMAKRNAFDRTDTVHTRVREKLAIVIEKMMKYLKLHLHKHQAEIKRRLEVTPLCPVQDGKVLVPTSRLVFEMDAATECSLRPYLFKAPRELGYCDEVLRSLGVKETATFDQLAGVLKEIHTSCKEDKMHPNEKRAGHTAVACMFQLLHQSKGNCLITVSKLYLPTPTDRLKRSTNLYYADTEQVEKLSKASVKLCFTVPLKQVFKQNWVTIEDTSESQLFRLLPPNLQPKDLCKEMDERLCPTNEACPQEDACPFVVRIKRKITSEEMQRVLLRLMQHQNEGKPPTDEQKTKVTELSKFENFRCMIKLKTVLCDGNNKLLVDDYETRRVFPVKSKNVDGSVIYLEHQDYNRVSRFFFRPLAEDINSICNLELDYKHLAYLRDVLPCSNVDRMNEVLSHDCHIPEYDSQVDAVRLDSEKPGSLVQQDIWHLLDDDPFNVFHPGEIVVYKRPVDDDSLHCYDQSLDTLATADTSQNEEYYFVFARIKMELPDEEAKEEPQTLNRKYKIDIGENEFINVSVLMLYKFRRPRKATETTVAVFTGDPDSEVPEAEATESHPENIKEAKTRIRNAIKEAFALPEKERNEAIRRLYKMWHPDKNLPEQNTLYTQAFQFLKQEIEHQKKGGSSDDYYSQRYSSWESDIRREREQERNYQQRYKYESENNTFHSRRSRRSYDCAGSFVPPSFCEETPDPRRARLWYRQAEGLLHKAEEEIQLPLNSPWLLAFLIHQVVEKALKAAKFYQNGNADTTSTDLLLLVGDLSIGSKSRELRPLVSQLIRLDVDFKKTRDPDSAKSRTSMQRYDGFRTEDALKLCSDILDIVRELVGIQSI